MIALQRGFPLPSTSGVVAQVEAVVMPLGGVPLMIVV